MFLSQAQLETAAPGQFILSRRLIWRDAEFGTIVVPAGTTTDFASIPQALRNLPIFDVNGVSRRPAILHDYLYHRGGESWDRLRADNLLRVALRAEGMSAAAAWLYYAGVRIGGRWAFHEARHSLR